MLSMDRLIQFTYYSDLENDLLSMNTNVSSL